MRLERALEGYWLAKKRDFSPATVRDYAGTFRRLVAHVGKDREVEKITARDINTLLNYMRDELELSRKTCLNAWIALSSFWTWAETELEIEHVIRKGVEKPKAKRPVIEPYTEAEVRALLAACDVGRGWDTVNNRRVESKRPTALRDKTMMLVMLDAGIRVSELCGLTVGDYKHKQGQLHVRHGKGDKERIIYIGDATRKYLWRYLNNERDNANRTDPLFATREGKPLDRYAVQKMIARAGDRAGVSKAGPHRFRHTFAINALRNGMNLLEVKELLGHETLATVQIYAKLAAVDLQEAQRRSSVADRWGL
jgi:integrase/recombinase XerD